MPSLSVAALERLIIEPPSSSSASSSSALQKDGDPSSSIPFSFYPPLYTTPATQQRPPSPSPSSPSPYVLNFKRRAPQINNGHGNTVLQNPISAASSQTRSSDNTSITPSSIDEGGKRSEGSTKSVELVVGGLESEVFDMEMEKRETLAEGIANTSSKTEEYGDDEMRMVDPSLNGSIVENLVLSAVDPSITANDDLEFFDAPDSALSDPSSEDEGLITTSTRLGRSIATQSCGTMNSRLQEEITRRILAEESSAQLQKRLNELAKKFPHFSFSRVSESSCSHQSLEAHLFDELSQEVIVARLVGGAIARAAIRAEKEEEMDSIVASKNREISRLWDKLQYLELVNREMFQRNQEITELTQRRRRRRQVRQKWAVGFFCSAFCIGAIGLACYKFIPLDQARALEFKTSNENISKNAQ